MASYVHSFTLGLALTFAFCPPILAAPQPTSKECDSNTTTAESPSEDPSCWSYCANSKTISGDWFGLRPKLVDHGVDIKFILNQQYMGVLNGGVDTNDSDRYAATFDTCIRLDFDKMFGFAGAEGYVKTRCYIDNGMNSFTGASMQVVDDADGKRSTHVLHAWYRQSLFDNALSLTLGYVEPQILVDRNKFANSEDTQFMNAVLDNNPLVPLPRGLTISAAYKPIEWYTLVAAVVDGQTVTTKPGFSTAFHEDALFTAYVENQFHVAIASSRGDLDGNYRIGVTYDPRQRTVFSESDAFAERARDHTWIFHASFDQMLYRESSDDNQGLGAFFRFGYRDEDTAQLNTFYSAGLSYLGPIPSRDKDVMGFGVAWRQASDTYKARVNDQAENETLYELFYKIQIAPWLSITPDVQFIDNPGGDGDFTQTLAGGVRIQMIF